jgi:hypothetical protein
MKMPVQCRKCEECLKARMRHWIGRLVAEQQTSKEVWFVTLTYGGGEDNELAQVLDYSDVQKLFKRLRKAGYKFKYLAVGEYGEEKGRAHWHILFYWNTEPPKVKMNEMNDWSFWPHGHSMIEYPRSTQAAAAYMMSYLSKGHTEGTILKYSKKPQLGEEYLLNKAAKSAKMGIPIFNRGNTFTVEAVGQTARNGENFYYPVERDSSLYEKMMKSYVLSWIKHRPKQKIATNPEIEEYIEEMTYDVEKLPKHVREYIRENYDYTASTQKVTKRNYQLDDDITVDLTLNSVTVNFHTHDGIISWQKENVINQEMLRSENLPTTAQHVVNEILIEREPQIIRLRRSKELTKKTRYSGNSSTQKTEKSKLYGKLPHFKSGETPLPQKYADKTKRVFKQEIENWKKIGEIVTENTKNTMNQSGKN